MDSLIADIAAKTRLPVALVRKSLAIIINFLSREAPPDRAAAMMERLSGARELAGEVSGGSSGVMGVFNDLTAAGLGLNGVQTVTRMFVAHARKEVGDADVDALVRSIPGLSTFV
jgi:hypothetical protein